MTRGIVAVICVFQLLIVCAKENEARPTSPPTLPPPTDTGREFKVEDFPNVNNSIFGAWEGDTAEFGPDGVYYILSLYFNDQNEVGQKRTCRGSNEVVEAAAVVSGEVNSSKIKINESVVVTEKGGRITDCTLTVDKGSSSYKRTGDRLEVTSQSGDMRSYTRVIP
jgi:hypothetical protein